MKHTKGKWEFKYNSIYVKKPKGKSFEVCRFIGYGGIGMQHDLIANAKLIAAAPELLEACIEALKHHQGEHSEIGFKLREAIIKATT